MAPKKAMRVTAAVSQKPASNVQNDSDSIVDDDATKSFRVPSALHDFEQKGKRLRPQIQAMVDWQRSLRSAGFIEAANLTKNTRGKESRKAFALS